MEPTLDLRIPGGRIASGLGVRSVGTGPHDRTGADYHLHDLIGEGGSGRVFRATQTALRRTVAVKMFHGTGPDDRIADLVVEARIAGSIAGAGAVPVHEVAVDQHGRPFMVMDLVSGGSWAGYASRWTPAEHIRFAADAARALHGIHVAGIVHRDIKPGNILVDAGRRPRIADWGLACTTADIRRGGRCGVSGTPGCLAPEQTTGMLEDIGPWTDVYLLAGALFEMLTGRLPHPGDTLPETLVSAAENRIAGPFPPGMVGSALSRALATIPSDRHRDAAAFAAELDACEACGHPSRSRRAALAAGVALTVASLGGAIGSGLIHDRGSTPAQVPGPAATVSVDQRPEHKTIRCGSFRSDGAWVWQVEAFAMGTIELCLRRDGGPLHRLTIRAAERIEVLLDGVLCGGRSWRPEGGSRLSIAAEEDVLTVRVGSAVVATVGIPGGWSQDEVDILTYPGGSKLRWSLASDMVRSG